VSAAARERHDVVHREHAAKTAVRAAPSAALEDASPFHDRHTIADGRLVLQGHSLLLRRDVAGAVGTAERCP
jgi:hypothetical protein